MSLSPDDIRSLQYGDALCIPRPNRTPERWRVNGALKTWVRTPERFELPLKRGLYEYGRISNTNLEVWNRLNAYIERAGGYTSS